MSPKALLLGFGLALWQLPALATTSPDGVWSGSVSCSANLLSGGPEYAQPLRLNISGSVGGGVIEDAQTTEHFDLQLGADGSVRIQSRGAWKLEPQRRWSLRTEGRLDGRAMRSNGPMVAGDGRTLVRERCLIELSQGGTPASGSGSSAGSADFAIEHAGEPLSDPLSTHPAARKYPMIAARFPEWLMAAGQPWAFRSTPTANPRQIRNGVPAAADQSLFAEARRLVASKEIKAIVFVDGDQVAYATGRPGLTPLSLLPSASVSKTVTAVGVGKAVCSGRVTLNSALGSLIPGLKAAPIGTASLRDALLMASGSAVHSHEITPAETSQHFTGPGSLEQLLLTPRFAELSASPGQRFVYKSIDPYLAAIAVQAVMGKPFSQFLQDEVFTPMGSGESVILDTDRQGYFLATGGVRMSLADWIRFAAYVREQRAGAGCFAEYLKAMSTAQLRIPKIPGVNGFFNGYGYFTWTDNDAAPGSVWAVGHFGQRIGWSTDPLNTRVFLTFGVESDRDMAALYPLAARWLRP
jgi:CubicO group peptidase (beta-lactamase class C family)